MWDDLCPISDFLVIKIFIVTLALAYVENSMGKHLGLYEIAFLA